MFLFGWCLADLCSRREFYIPSGKRVWTCLCALAGVVCGRGRPHGSNIHDTLTTLSTRQTPLPVEKHVVARRGLRIVKFVGGKSNFMYEEAATCAGAELGDGSKIHTRQAPIWSDTPSSWFMYLTPIKLDCEKAPRSVAAVSSIWMACT